MKEREGDNIFMSFNFEKAENPCVIIIDTFPKLILININQEFCFSNLLGSMSMTIACLRLKIIKKVSLCRPLNY